MRRILATCFVATLLAATNLPGQTADQPAFDGEDAAPPVSESSPPAPPPTADADSPPTPLPTDPPPAFAEPAPSLPAPAADGTTSVIAPPAAAAAADDLDAPPALPPPAVPPATVPPASASPATGPPAESIAPPPADSFAPPPPSESAALLASLLEPLAGSPAGAGADPLLYARPLPLLEPLVRSGDRSRRLWIVQAYWKVATGFALVRSASDSVARLELVAPGGDPYDRATLDVAAAAARADLADATARLSAAQQELVDLARLTVGEPLPWPIDRPLADPYQTHFEAIFANRIATGRVRGIVRSLPVRHEALAGRAAAVTAATTARDMAEADHARGKRPIEAFLAAHAVFITQQAAFLEAVRTYNLEIAEYAMAVADLSLPDEQFVAMLIAAPAAWRPQPIEPVAATAFPPPAAAAPPPAVALPPALVAPPGFFPSVQ
jgi:hypothetical protein